MLITSNTTLQHVSVHQVGNKTNGEDLIISKQEMDISDENLNERLKQFFLKKTLSF